MAIMAYKLVACMALLAVAAAASADAAAATQQQQHRALRQAASPSPDVPTANPPDAPVPDLSSDSSLLASIPKLPASDAAPAAAQPGKNGTTSKPATSSPTGQVVSIDKFKPNWPAGKKPGPNALLASIQTDTDIPTLQENGTPLIQSLAAATGVPVDQIYFYKVTTYQGLQNVTLLLDAADADKKQSALTALSTPDTTAKFYDNAKAYSVNVLNGPTVPQDQLDLGTDAISTPDPIGNYNGDTGQVKANETYDGSTFAQSSVVGLAPLQVLHYLVTLPLLTLGLGAVVGAGLVL